jgi:hypothetical protein
MLSTIASVVYVISLITYYSRHHESYREFIFSLKRLGMLFFASYITAIFLDIVFNDDIESIASVPVFSPKIYF